MADETEDEPQVGVVGSTNEPVPLFGADDTKVGRLKGLSFFGKIHEMVVGGWPPKEVVQFIRKKKELLDLTEEKVMRLVLAYRNTLPDFDRAVRIYPEDAKHALERVEEGIDELEELEKLYLMQMARLKIDMATEREIEKLLPTTVNEIRAAKDLLMARAQLKMDLGLDAGARGKLAEATGDPDDAMRARHADTALVRVMGSPESRQKFLSAFGKLTKLNSMPEKSPVDVEFTTTVEG